MNNNKFFCPGCGHWNVLTDFSSLVLVLLLEVSEEDETSGITQSVNLYARTMNDIGS
jgi:RNA polymerase subunit RPABC4/transcription elongation factor Spt4